MVWIKTNWFKLAILLVAILGIMTIVAILDERATEERRVTNAKLAAEKEQQEREYAADQKKECRTTYETESDKWNNVRGWRYDEYEDLCEITYNDPNKTSKAACEKEYKDRIALAGDSSILKMDALIDKLHCEDGTFTKEF